MEYKDLIESKNSVRDYKEKEVDAATVKKIRDFAQSCERLDDSIGIDIRFMDNDTVYRQVDGYAGYKGILINAPHYMIVLSEKKDHYIENGGYVGESISVKAHSLGVDSCWITFKDSRTVIEKLNIVTDKEVVAIMALGYGKKRFKKVTGNVTLGKGYANADFQVKDSVTSPRMPLEEIVFLDTWGNKATVDELVNRAVYEPLNYARMAPSTLNRQPWRFIIDGGLLILTVRDDEDTNLYEEQIDAGIVMLYCKKVMRETLCEISWNLEPVENKYNIPDNYKIVASCSM